MSSVEFQTISALWYLQRQFYTTEPIYLDEIAFVYVNRWSGFQKTGVVAEERLENAGVMT